MVQEGCKDCKCCAKHTVDTCKEHCGGEYKELDNVEHSECQSCVCNESDDGKEYSCIMILTCLTETIWQNQLDKYQHTFFSSRRTGII